VLSGLLRVAGFGFALDSRRKIPILSVYARAAIRMNTNLWQLAANQFHNLRDIDRDTRLFRCFTCDSWFDVGTGQLDRNFNYIAKEPEICPIAQAMLFSE